VPVHGEDLGRMSRLRGRPPGPARVRRVRLPEQHAVAHEERQQGEGRGRLQAQLTTCPQAEAAEAGAGGVGAAGDGQDGRIPFSPCSRLRRRRRQLHPERRALADLALDRERPPWAATLAWLTERPSPVTRRSVRGGVLDPALCDLSSGAGRGAFSEQHRSPPVDRGSPMLP